MYSGTINQIENETCVNLPSKSIMAGLHVSLLCVLCMSIKMPHDAHLWNFNFFNYLVIVLISHKSPPNSNFKTILLMT